MQSSENQSLLRYLRPLRDYWFVILLVTAIALGLGVAANKLVDTNYESKASILVNPITSDPGELFDDSGVDMDTETRLARSFAVAEVAAERLSLTEAAGDPRDLLEQASAAGDAGTRILDILFEAPTAEQARLGAQAFADGYLDYRGAQAAAAKEAAATEISNRIGELKVQLTQLEGDLLVLPEGSQEALGKRVEADSVRNELSEQQSLQARLSTIFVNPGELVDPARAPRAATGLTFMQILLGALVGGLTLGIALAYVLAALKNSDEQYGASTAAHAPAVATAAPLEASFAAVPDQAAIAVAAESPAPAAITEKAMEIPAMNEIAAGTEPEAPSDISAGFVPPGDDAPYEEPASTFETGATFETGDASNPSDVYDTSAGFIPPSDDPAYQEPASTYEASSSFDAASGFDQDLTTESFDDQPFDADLASQTYEADSFDAEATGDPLTDSYQSAAVDQPPSVEANGIDATDRAFETSVPETSVSEASAPETSAQFSDDGEAEPAGEDAPTATTSIASNGHPTGTDTVALLAADGSFDTTIRHLQRVGSEHPVVTLVVEGDTAPRGLPVGFWRAQEVADTGARVLVIDLQLHDPKVHTMLGTSLAPGLAEVLHGQEHLRRTVRTSSQLGAIEVLTVGDADDTTREQILGGAFQELIAEARRRYHVILLIGGPIHGSNELRTIARGCDGVIVGSALPVGGMADDALLAELGLVPTEIVSMISVHRPVAANAREAAGTGA